MGDMGNKAAARKRCRASDMAFFIGAELGGIGCAGHGRRLVLLFRLAGGPWIGQTLCHCELGWRG